MNDAELDRRLDRYKDYEQMDAYPAMGNAFGPYADDATPIPDEPSAIDRLAAIVDWRARLRVAEIDRQRSDAGMVAGYVRKWAKVLRAR